MRWRIVDPIAQGIIKTTRKILFSCTRARRGLIQLAASRGKSVDSKDESTDTGLLLGSGLIAGEAFMGIQPAVHPAQVVDQRALQLRQRLRIALSGACSVGKRGKSIQG